MNTKRFPLGVPLLALAFALAGCGGVSSNSNAGSANLPSSGPSPGAGGPVSAPVVVQVGSGGTASGISISVPGPAASPAPNAQVLGVATGSGGTASNTGDVIHRGETASVLLFGPGLNGSMTVSIGGPNDISITNVRGITSTTGTPGVAFTASVSGGAALGARTVFLMNSQNDITAFAGGLEVVP